MTDSLIQVTRSGRTLRVALNRPKKKNALTKQMYLDLKAALDSAAADPEILVVILAGEGDGFTAGNDLGEFAAAPDVSPDAPVIRFLATLSRFPKILVAAVHGVAVGIGTTMLLHCDLVVAATNTRFALPFINLALVPEAASSLLLPARIGHARASELLLLGEPFTAKAAFDMGLVNRLVEPEALAAAVEELASRIAAKAPSALLATKRLLKSESTTVSARMAEENIAFGAQLQSSELQAAITAFFKSKAAS